MLLLGIEEILEMGELGDGLGEILGCFRLGSMRAMPGGIDVLETDFRAGLDDQFLAVIHDEFQLQNSSFRRKPESIATQHGFFGTIAFSTTVDPGLRRDDERRQQYTSIC